MRVVKLYGELGKRFGSEHHFDVRSPAEAIRALIANFEGFEKYMRESESNNIGFKVINGDHELSKVEEVRDPATREIKIIPVVLGANAGTRILIGAALIVASIVAAPFLPAASPIMMNVGIALVLGGVIEMLSPPPKIDGPSERAENTPSYFFNGAVNTNSAGHPIPVGYGRLIVGGAVISAGLSIEQLKAGFKRISVLKTVDVIAVDYPESYFIPPPANAFGRVLLETGTYTEDFLFPGIRKYWKYRFQFYEWVVVPA